MVHADKPGIEIEASAGMTGGDAHRLVHDHSHNQSHGSGARAAGGGSAPAVVHLRPSAMRMGLAGRLGIAAALAAVAWTATLMVLS